MGINSHPPVAVVTRPTRLSGLKRRWSTSSAAKFRMRSAASHEVQRRIERRRRAGKSVDSVALLELEQDVDELYAFDEYQREHELYDNTLKSVSYTHLTLPTICSV